jgi:hypothetical protein
MPEDAGDNSRREVEYQLKRALEKLEELRQHCFEFQTRASGLVVETIHHITEVQELLDGQDTSERPETA